MKISVLKTGTGKIKIYEKDGSGVLTLTKAQAKTLIDVLTVAVK